MLATSSAFWSKLGFDLDKDVIEAFDGKYLKFVKCIEGEDDDDDDVDGVLKKLRKESRALRRSLEGDISEEAAQRGGRRRRAAVDAGPQDAHEVVRGPPR